MIYLITKGELQYLTDLLKELSSSDTIEEYYLEELEEALSLLESLDSYDFQKILTLLEKQMNEQEITTAAETVIAGGDVEVSEKDAVEVQAKVEQILADSEAKDSAAEPACEAATEETAPEVAE